MDRYNYKNIIFIAPYQELAEKAKLVIGDMKLGINVVHMNNLQDSVDYINNYMKNHNIEAVITRGGTALKLKEEFSFPVVEIEVTLLDIIKSIKKAKEYSNKLGVIGFKNVISNVASLSAILELDIHEIIINSINECSIAVKYASELGVDAIVGDRIAVETANRYGIKGELIESDSYECITNAVYKAMNIADISRRQIAHYEELRIITELTQSGIIAVDKSGIVTLFNAESERILNCKASDFISRELMKLMPELDIFDVLENGVKKFDEIIEVKEKYIVVHKIPILIRGNIDGAVITFQKTENIHRLEQKVRKKMSEKGHIAKFTFQDMIGESESISKIIQKAKNYSKVDSTILIHGDTGTGKEVFAQSIHNESLRRNGPFIAVNCAALPYTLLESELFGYVKGSFTGAKDEGKIGLFEQANGGTIFLDEIGEIPMEVQARLLRVLQEGQVQKIGDDKIITVDVRIISATNKNLKELIKDKKFREDLYYRINVLNIKLPTLNERLEDIPVFIKRFVKEKATAYSKVILNINDGVIEKLCKIKYPGNIRQLENIVERLVVEAKDGEIKATDLNAVLEEDTAVDDVFLSINTITKETIEKALVVTNNNKTKAAKILGIDRSTLWRKIKELEIE